LAKHAAAPLPPATGRQSKLAAQKPGRSGKQVVAHTGPPPRFAATQLLLSHAASLSHAAPGAPGLGGACRQRSTPLPSARQSSPAGQPLLQSGAQNEIAASSSAGRHSPAPSAQLPS
jgi:hypothetical protein